MDKIGDILINTLGRSLHLLLFLFIFPSALLSAAGEPLPPAELFKSEPKTLLTTEGKITYVMEAGKERLLDAEGKEKVEIFFVSYTKEEMASSRPIAFCFNGGPGSAAIWLHMGAFGPKRVAVTLEGGLNPPYIIENNPYTLLDYADLVFVDPVSTGFSKVAKGEDPKQYFGVDEDIKLMSEFVRHYITKNGRWTSPKYLIGESYGTARVIGMADYLLEKHRVSFDGLILLSTVTNLSWIRGLQPGNDLPYVFYLPSYTAAAFYHKKLSAQEFKTVDDAVNASRSFAKGPYLLALMQGDQLKPNEKKEVAETLSKLTGISPEWIIESNIRIPPLGFGQELLRREGKVIGRFDARYASGALDYHSETLDYDPSQDSIFTPYVAAINQYLRDETGWEKAEEYRYLVHAGSWNFCRAGNESMNMGDSLREVMIRNPAFKVFAAIGIYDLATPLLSQEYIFQHLNIQDSLKSNLLIRYYPAGHMMYIDQPSLAKMKEELKLFFKPGKYTGIH